LTVNFFQSGKSWFGLEFFFYYQPECPEKVKTLQSLIGNEVDHDMVLVPPEMVEEVEDSVGQEA
jgi:hypothetical protein